MKRLKLIVNFFLCILIIISCSEDNPSEPIPDTKPPSVSIVSPLDGALVSGTMTILAQVSDNVGVTKLEFVIGSNLYETLLSPPWQCECDVKSYSHGSNMRLNAVAYDLAGNKTTSIAVTVKISNPPQPQVDVIPPATITDLIISEATSSSLKLTWTSPGDDGNNGTASNYELKYSSSVITEQNYSQASSCLNLPSPQSAGNIESYTLTGLMATKTYYFGIKTRDQEQNISELSNIVVGTTKMELFTKPLAYPIVGGNYPSAESIVSADFDGDGDYDIAAAAMDGLSVVFSDGTGAFGAPVYYSLGVTAKHIATGDFDNDGDKDVVIAFSATGKVGVISMLNPGNGKFQKTSTNYTTSLPRDICVADLNSDGYSDLAIAHDNYVGGVLETGADVLLGNGDGTFKPVINYPVEGWPWNVSAGDFDGDKDNDLVVSCYNNKMVWVLWNTGNGTFQSAVNVLEGSFGSHSTAVLAADFNKDGYCDIAATNDNPYHVNILLGAGNATFDFKGSNQTGGLPRAIATADFDGDGKADLATPGNSNGNVSVILGKGDGTFKSSLFFHVESALWDISTGDYDRDGDFDLAVLWGYRIYILLNTTIN